jgi:hypothetical protein
MSFMLFSASITYSSNRTWPFTRFLVISAASSLRCYGTAPFRTKKFLQMRKCYVQAWWVKRTEIFPYSDQKSCHYSSSYHLVPCRKVLWTPVKSWGAAFNVLRPGLHQQQRQLSGECDRYDHALQIFRTRITSCSLSNDLMPNDGNTVTKFDQSSASGGFRSPVGQ